VTNVLFKPHHVNPQTEMYRGRQGIEVKNEYFGIRNKTDNLDMDRRNGVVAAGVMGIELAIKLFPDEICDLILVGNERKNDSISPCKQAFRDRRRRICHTLQFSNIAESLIHRLIHI
jgi:hypothetical protein